MNKFLAAASIVTMTIGHAALAKPATSALARPVFDFKGIVADQSADMSLLKDCHTSDDETECYFKDGSVAGLSSTLPPSIYLYNNKLATMLYLFSAKGTDFLTLEAALQTKYGPPCKTETQPWQSRAGAKYDNTVITWCFKTGKLELEQLSTSLDYGDLIYTDDVNKAPAKAPTVDF